jgi:hypothetical protein
MPKPVRASMTRLLAEARAAGIERLNMFEVEHNLCGTSTAGWRAARRQGPYSGPRRATPPQRRPAPPRKLARPEGLEPPTPRFEAWCSIRLSYGRGVAHHSACREQP